MFKPFLAILSGLILLIVIVPGTRSNAQNKPLSVAQATVAGCEPHHYYVPSAQTCIDGAVITDDDCKADAQCVKDNVLYWRYYKAPVDEPAQPVTGGWGK